MAEKYFIDEIASWFQNHPIVMFLLGVVALVFSFSGSAQYQAILCVSSGLVNFTTSIHQCYKQMTLGGFASMANFLGFIGLLAAIIGLFNIDENPSLLLPYASFATGFVAIVAFLMSKIQR